MLALRTRRLSEQSGISEVFGDQRFWESLWRTFVLAAVVSIFTLVLGTLYAIALAVAPRWLAIVMLIALFTIFWTSLLVRTYGWMLLYLPEGGIYTFLHAVGLRDRPLEIFQTNFASYPAMVHVMLPFVVFPVFAATRQLDPMQIRAARVLGARPLLILWKVVLPALRAGMAAGAVLVFVMSLGFYVTPTLLGSQTKPLVSSMIGQSFHAPGEAPVGGRDEPRPADRRGRRLRGRRPRVPGQRDLGGGGGMNTELRLGLGISRVAFVVLGGIFAIFMVLPLLVIVPTSWTAGQLVEFPPEGFSLQWYEKALEDPRWTESFVVSLQVALFGGHPRHGAGHGGGAGHAAAGPRSRHPHRPEPLHPAAGHALRLLRARALRDVLPAAGGPQRNPGAADPRRRGDHDAARLRGRRRRPGRASTRASAAPRRRWARAGR